MAEIFQPVRGIEESIKHMPIREGYIYFAYDTGNIYMDKNGARYLMGGSSTGILYAAGNDDTIIKNEPEVDTDYHYTISSLALEDPNVLPLPDTLILNSDGRFFRVLSINDNGKINAILLAVSGTGGGINTGGGGIIANDLKLTWDESTIAQGHVFIYGINSQAIFIPEADTGDSKVSLTFTIIDNTGNHDNIIFTEPSINNGSRYVFDTSKLPLSSNITMRITISASNSQMVNQSRTYSINYLKTIEMGIKKVSDKYLPLIPADDAAGTLELSYIPVGDVSVPETLHILVDEEEIATNTIQTSWYNRTVTINIPRQSHGSHTIALYISANVNNRQITTDSIIFEAAWAGLDSTNEPLTEPIIWVGKYDDVVINYENSYIKYMVYDPISIQNGLPASVQLYKNNVMVSELSLTYSSTGWAEWDISSIYEVGNNVFSVVCRGIKKDIIVYVTEEGSRDLGLARATSLLENFSAAGRSSLEVKSARGVWNDFTGNYSAELSGFNWQNNGWKRDNVTGDEIDSGTYLSIANSAKVTIPTPSIRLNFDKDFTIEARFRIRNVQKYSTLVQTVPMYFYQEDDGNGNMIQSSESKTMAWILANNKTVWYDEYGSPLMDEANVQKIYETENGVICKWMNENEYGLVIGSQEAYFRSPRGVISVRYKEDEVVNISCVIERGGANKTGLVYIYLNGILSGADALPQAGQTGQFTINTPFIFNSDYCDVDLYRFRIFQTSLSMPDVIHNYLSDMHSIKLYDQNQLTDEIDPTQLDYNLLLRYNEEHPDELTMPYATWKIKDGNRNEKLPYFKGDECKADVTFVNPIGNKKLDDGDITAYEYYAYSPSFYATDVDINVQGTSSQGYPRRNYKLKYKKATSWIYTHGPLTGCKVATTYYFYKSNGALVTTTDEENNIVPLTDDTQYDSSTMTKLANNFHMDNPYVGVNKFTWKIDYMESSGSYNTGFANLLGNLQYPLYTKHPIGDLGLDATGLRTTVYGYPVLTFHEYEDYSNNPSNPGVKYEYIGRYNMNLDKGANEAYGFESKSNNPYNDKQIKKIAECWELSDNQGTWCSFKFPSAASREIGFGTTQSGYPERLEMIRHFEYRYSAYGDQLDAIGADGNYDGSTTDTAIIAEIGTNDAQKSAYIRSKYINLEKLFYWLDSTDTSSVPTEDKTIYERTPVQAEDGSVRIIKTAINSVTYSTATSYAGKEGATSVAQGSGGYRTTFTKDIAEYRLEKFRNEFSQHLDLEYCLVYFVLTELLLCYDSRGKNMMLASLGPHEEGGDYIWYPIFYDIDTQLGLNNSGAYLWDYDADVTLDGLFSTPGSVLWTNLYAMFQNEIKNKYKVFRGYDDGSIVKNNLTYDKIAGAYECNPNVFNSTAMCGIRPVIAIGLDEYYKYFATTASGYFDTNGTIIIEDTPQFAYACQGDKKLTTELLLRNRLNYIDSWWLGGSYDINQFKQGQFWGRVNGNRMGKTSDIYLNMSDNEIAIMQNSDSKYNGFKHADYPLAYFDARPNFKLKPFLKQYITYFTDEVPVVPVKYSATIDEQDGILTEADESKLSSYLTKAEEPNEQLVYLPGLDFLSSMGDLSTQYFSEFHLTAGKRLLDLTLGSDVPGYKNNLLDATKPFDIADGPNSNTKKSLLKKVVLSNMTTFDKTIAVQGSEKLQEFRALGTILNGVYFAEGAPLHTVHLPGTITTLELIENKDLTKILNEKPKVAKWVNKITHQEVQFANITDWNSVEVQFAEPETYRGLYLENITDYNNTLANVGHPINSIVIEGGGLNYGSYQILNNLIKLKDEANENNLLSISLKDVTWTPYELVEYGENYNSNIIYYRLNDHSSFEGYNYTNTENWNFDTLNGLVYTKNNLDESIIQDTSLLDKLIEKYEEAKAGNTFSQFANTSGLSTATVPTITGTMYIDNVNTDMIPEADLTSIYKKYFPNLDIQAARIREANVTKYVRKLDTGVIEVLETQRSAGDNPLPPTGQLPAKANYDFVGWALDENGTNMFIRYYNARNNDEISGYINQEEIYNNYSFESNNTNVLVLYAIFKLHQFAAIYYNQDGSIIDTLYIDGGALLEEPDFIPYKNDNDCGLKETYKFNGYSMNPSDTTEVTSLPPLIINKDLKLYATYSKESVYNNVLRDSDYYTLTTSTINGITYQILQLNNEKFSKLKGKITLPAEINGIKVTGFNNLGPTYYNNESLRPKNITHIFWEEGSELSYIGIGACYKWDSLRYFELPNLNTILGTNAFRETPQLFKDISQENTDLFFRNIYSIGSNAFCSVSVSSTNISDTLTISSLGSKSINLPNIVYIYGGAFANTLIPSGIVFGSPENENLDCRNWAASDQGASWNYNNSILLGSRAEPGFMDASPVNITYYSHADIDDDSIMGELQYRLNLQSSGDLIITIAH